LLPEAKQLLALRLGLKARSDAERAREATRAGLRNLASDGAPNIQGEPKSGSTSVGSAQALIQMKNWYIHIFLCDQKNFYTAICYNKAMKFQETFKLIFAIVVCELAGIVGSFFTAPAIPTWYAGLVKPEFAPPNWLFAPVWTTLFALMGVALWLVWEKGWDKKRVKIAIMIFAVQLILNTLWSILFFGWQNPLAAFIEIIFLWLAIVATMAAFARISRAAAWLLAPYLVWVSFALYLNYMLWVLN